MTPVITLIGIIISAVAACSAAYMSIMAVRTTSNIHVLINSRMSELLALTKTSSFAAGQKDEYEKSKG